jgi:quercetin dioxygenase-like cupin family protein
MPTNYEDAVTKLQTAEPGINPAEEIISVGGLALRFLLTGDHSSGTIAAFEMTVPGGKKLPAPAHSHERYEETIYGLTGALTWTVDGTAFKVGPGQALCIPRGAVHRFDNDTEHDAKALCVITPAALGPEYFREMAGILHSAGGGPPDRARVIEIMLRHGLKPAAPPV